jgi:two-component system, LuxR family, sensor kinase FixL
MTALPTALSSQSLLDAAPEAVIVVDQRGRLEEFNLAAEQLFGYTKAEIVGANISQLLPGPHVEHHDGHIAPYLPEGFGPGAAVGREVDARRKDGSEFPVWISLCLIPNRDSLHYIGFMHDISSRRKVENHRNLAGKKETELRHLKELTDMTADLAHEINQPLAAISNYALACERLLGFPTPNLVEVSGALREISKQALRAGESLQRLRDAVKSRKQSSTNEALTRG